MSDRIDNFIIREADGVRAANSLVLGRGFGVTLTAGGLPELAGLAGEALLMPSGGDDTAAIRTALAHNARVRLGPGGFLVTGTISLAEGQGVVGAGPAQTYVLPDHPDAVFSLAHRTALESLAIIGPNTPSPNSVGVVSPIAEDVRLHRLRVDTIHRGIQLGGAQRVELSEVSVYATQTDAVSVSGGGGGDQVVVAGLTVEGSGGTGLSISSLDCVSLAGVTVRDCATGIRVSQGSSLALQAVRVSGCGEGLVLLTTRGVEVAGAHLFECESGIRVEGSLGVMLGGCTVVRGEGTSLTLRGCTAATVSGFLSDQTGQVQGVSPHVLVDGGSTQVALTGVQRVNPPIPPQFEVNVSGAGGRVVFIQHNFDPARINSGGRFVAL